MKVAIFGATGRTGRLLTEQALAASYDVVALVRDPARMSFHSERLTVVQGDAMDPPAVERTIAGTDAVICVLGHSKGSPKDLQTVAARNIVAAMRRCGVRRLVTLTGAGVAAPQDRPRLANRVIKLALVTIAGDVYRDGKRHAEVIQQSPLDWVIVRGPMLYKGPLTGIYRIGWVGVNTGARIARANVADFLLKQVSDTAYLHQMPMISD